MMQELEGLKEYIKKNIPSAKIYNISNAEGISWQSPNEGYHYDNIPSGLVIILAN